MSKARCVLAVLGLGAVVAAGLAAAGPATPALVFRSPQAGAVLSGDVPVVVEAAPESKFSFLVFGVDEERPAATNARPLRWVWETTAWADGTHSLWVEAYGPEGLVGKAGPLRVTVRNRPAASAPPASPPQTPRVEPTLLPVPEASKRGAAERGRVCVDGRAVDAPLHLLGGMALVPLRPVVNALEGSISWDAHARAVGVAACGRAVTLVVADERAVVDGVAVRLEKAPRLEQGRVLMAARVLARLLGLDVGWDPAVRTIHLWSVPLRPTGNPGATRTAEARF
ncbi:MAG: stalk domain-containing protein [Armatimonadota bacterium]|nr:stalk domain-containing protein [Armatimonadota bacterium]